MDERLSELSKKWGVSKTAVLEKLLKISPDFYPERNVTVFDIGNETTPFVIGCDEDWKKPFTGFVSIKLPPSEGVEGAFHLIIYAKDLTFEDLISQIQEGITNK